MPLARTSSTDVVHKARQFFAEALEGEIGRRGQTRLVENNGKLTGPVVMQFLAGALAGAATLPDGELRKRLSALATRLVTQLVAGRTGEVAIVAQYPPKFHREQDHLLYDWHAGAVAPGDHQHRTTC